MWIGMATKPRVSRHMAVAAPITPSLDQILDFCAGDPVERVFLEDVARRGLGRFSAVAENGRLEALCHVGANVVPSGRGCGAFAYVTSRSRARMLIGEEQAVSDLWSAVGSDMPCPLEDRPGQPVYVIEEPPGSGDSGLREATTRDLDLLVPACAQAHFEEIGIDPLRRDREGFRWRTQAQIGEGRSWVWLDGDTILFKAEASAWTPYAVQLQQVCVDPSARGNGYGTRGGRDRMQQLPHHTR